MQLDLFSGLRRLQLAGLNDLQRRCADTDFADREEAYALDAKLQALGCLMSCCAALETLHIHPLLAGKAQWAFELARHRHYLNNQFKLLQTRLGAICSQTLRLSPAWRNALTTEGRVFTRELESFAAFLADGFERQRGAMRAIMAGCNGAEVGAAHWHLASALSLLAEPTPTIPGPQAEVLFLDQIQRSAGRTSARRRRIAG